MDIASRIKFFMNSIEVGSSQFADICQIPRPTLSQILNGRNKKISDEIIGKIHDAYPQLSVLWLMFGEGDMTLDTNIKISEPQSGSVIDFEMEQPSADEHFIDQYTLPLSSQEFISEKKSGYAVNPLEDTQAADIKKSNISAADITDSSNKEPQPEKQRLKSLSSKKIVSIMVFYDDNSFETFSPRK